MRKFIQPIAVISAICLLFACSKDDDDENNGTTEGTVTGNIGGVTLNDPDVFSHFSTNAINNDNVLYVEVWDGFSGNNNPSSDGKALMIRIEPYNGPGTYGANENSFWTFRENIQTDGTWQNNTFIQHEYGDDLPQGAMSVVISKDETLGGTRVISGTLNGESGRTKSFDGMDQQELTLQTFKIEDMDFVAPERSM
ncbi:MAG: hypothetical protein JJU02_16920 [Cryomorphaceae bacterium]|nr:hypothetical protein [Cryomorphaceae bacterium]